MSDSDSSPVKQQTPHIIPIHILDDDSLLNIFHLYRPFFLGEDEDDGDRLNGGTNRWDRGRWWYRLIHVCQRWRFLILDSASYLRLSLVCTYRTPVANMLAHSPPLPLTVDYDGEDGITAEEEEALLLALEQRHRLRHLRLFFPVPDLQRLVMAIDFEFPILEYLIVEPSKKNDTALMLPESLQAPNLHHLMLGGFTCPIRPRLHPTSTGIVTLHLAMHHQSAYFPPNILLQWISSIPQLESLDIAFKFPVPNRDIERQLTRSPITTHITLPNLRLFTLVGVSAYLEAVLGRTTTPRLEKLQIRLFKQLTFSVPHLSQFINTTENFRFDSAAILFMNTYVFVEMVFTGSSTYVFHSKIDCWHLDWQVFSMVQIFNALKQSLSMVKDLVLGYEEHSESSGEHNDVDRIHWRNILGSFGNVKTLRIQNGLVGELSRCLRLEDGELLLELLPELEEVTYFGSRDTQARDAFTSFIDARQKAGRPVRLIRAPSSPLSSGPPTNTSLNDEAGNDVET